VPQHREFLEKLRRQRLGLEPQKILDLRQGNQHGNAVGKTDDERLGEVFDQRAQLEGAHGEQHETGHDGADQQIGVTVLGDDAVNDNDERAGRPADLHARSAQGGNQKAGDDGSENTGLGFGAGGDGERDGQRQGNDTDS